MPAPTAEDVLKEFVEDINVNGGLTADVGTMDAKPSGMPTPAGAPEWIDLAVTYLKACKVLGVEPVYAEDDEDDEDDDTKDDVCGSCGRPGFDCDCEDCDCDRGEDG